METNESKNDVSVILMLINKGVDEAVACRLYFLRRIIVLQELGRLSRKEKDFLNQRLIVSKIFFLQEYINVVENVLKEVYKVDIRHQLNKDKSYLLTRIDREVFTKLEYKPLCKLIGDVDDVIDRLIMKHIAAGYNSPKFRWFDPDRRVW